MVQRMMGGQGRRVTHILGTALCLMASHAWGQETQPRGPGAQPPGTATEPALISPSAVPSIAAYPLELLGLLAPPAQRGPVTLMPSIAVGEEYNDNVFLSSRNRQSDFITSFGPAITLYVNRPSYQLNAGYSFSAVVYAREERLNNAFDSQNFIAGGLYRVSPALTLIATDTFAFNRNTNLVTSQNFSTGRQESWNNTFTPGMTWQMTATNTLSLTASYSVLRFEGAAGGVASGAGGEVASGAGGGVASDTYGFQSSLTHIFTPRFAGIIGYGFTYLDPQGQDTSTTHTPTLGFSYRLTPTLSAIVNGGPAVTELGGTTTVSPAGNASLTQTLGFGSASLQYTRGVSVAGGFGGTTNTQTVSGTLTLSALQRGLLVVLNPAYSVAKSVSSQQTAQADVQAFTLGLAAYYQVARYTTLFAGYTFFQQHTGGSSSVQRDVDQNRVRFGLQFGYPINFD